MLTELQDWSNIASIATLVTTTVGLFGYFHYCLEKRSKRRRLENHLKLEWEKEVDKGQRTFLHLVRHVGLTESEILQASFKSKRIGRRLGIDEDGFAKTLLFVYLGASPEAENADPDAA